MDRRPNRRQEHLPLLGALTLMLSASALTLGCYGGPTQPGDRAGMANQKLAITPSQALVTVGEPFQFTASSPWGGQVTWGSLPANGGSFDGTGRFTASLPGTSTVVATLNSDVRYTAQAVVRAVPAPVATITAPALVAIGASGLKASVPEQPGCTFQWSAQGATLTSGANSREITFAVGSTGPVTLQAKVTNEAGSSATQTFQVALEGAPRVLSFTADRTLVIPGTTVQLTPVFTGTGAAITPGGWSVTSGVPQAAVVNTTTDYLLTVQNRLGQTATASVRVQVVDPNPPGNPVPGDLWTDPLTGIRMRYCPAGTFQMGAHHLDPEGRDEERPQHGVTFAKGFWISEGKITQAQFTAATGGNPAFFVDRDACSRFGALVTRPVEQVSWPAVQDYLRALNAALGQAAYRLPSESEWEYAYRAGTTTPYYWGTDGTLAPHYGWIVSNAGGLTQAPGLGAPNAWNLNDMVGNAMEWVADSYLKDHVGAPTDGTPSLAAISEARTVRGSAWNDPAKYARASARHAGVQATADRTLGFRVVRPHVDAPKILSFTAPAKVAKGTPVTLTWNVQGATSLWIDRQVGDVTGSTQKVLSMQQTTLFTLIARGPGGWTMSTVLVEVQ